MLGEEKVTNPSLVLCHHAIEFRWTVVWRAVRGVTHINGAVIGRMIQYGEYVDIISRNI